MRVSTYEVTEVDVVYIFRTISVALGPGSDAGSKKTFPPPLALFQSVALCRERFKQFSFQRVTKYPEINIYM